MTVEFKSTNLRALVAAEEGVELERLVDVLIELGHEVIAQEVSVKEVAQATARELPDVAFVLLGLSADHALDLIGEIVHEAACPVIAMLSMADAAYVREAAKRGIFASVFHDDPDELRDAIEIALHRFADYNNLQAAFARRAAIEQAKGILMSRNAMSSDQAFASLREYAGRNRVKIADVAAAVVQSHGLLLPEPPEEEASP